jgi:lipopolysaccharide/colanic/teichoic acid biosynthesis glycosyltransferase
MDPDILSSAGEALAGRPDWPASVERPARDTDSVEATSQTGTTRPSRLASAVAHAPAWPRSGTGTGVATGHGHGYTNGHARPRSAAHGGWNTERAAASAAILAFETPRPAGLYLKYGKRTLDVLGAIVAIVLTAPIVALLAAIIKLESRGSVFYRSTRIGRGGRPFTFYKLRSMVKDADRHRQKIEHMNEADGPVFKIARDPRVTRVGRFIRSTSLDELPQFYNVLIGDMSLVGPRPPIPQEVAQYEPWQLRRLDVRPGITCLWQISGRSRLGFQEWMRLDLEYIKHQSPVLDVKILLRTVPAVLSREGAY